MKVTGQAASDEIFLMSERSGIEEREGRAHAATKWSKKPVNKSDY